MLSVDQLEDKLIDLAFAEDIGDGDHTTLCCIPEDAMGKSHLLIKEDGVLAGVEMAKKVFARFDPTMKVEVLLQDGTHVKKGDIAMIVEGKTRSLLQTERLMLNIMQRMSGIATMTAKYVKRLEGTKTHILDTRKTTPGLRMLEKQAVKIGGGMNHRIGLFDMILLKDNHIDFAGGIDNAIDRCHAYLKEKGLDENTIVIFTSDNGPHEEGGADPDFFNRDGLLQGKKRSTYEGGIRIPFIVRWPGHVKAGTVNDHQLAFYDLMPTFCDLAGIKSYEKRYRNKSLANDYFDGISFYPTLIGKGKQKKHDYLYWEFHETNMMGLRMGNWKLVVKAGQCRLYDLATDLHEDHDIAAKHPDIVKKMKDIILKEHTDSPIFKLTLPK